MPPSFRVTRDTPALYLTSVTKDRLPVFRTSAIAAIACRSLVEASKSGKFLIFAYALMPDHLHVITDSSQNSTDVLRFINGIISRRVIDHLKENAHEESLEKLRIQKRPDGWQYSLWQHHPNTRLIWSERMLWQRIQYTHLNPVRLGLVDHPNEWRWSSSRIFSKRRSDDEPIEIDLDRIKWTY